jgi:hypothetical protein
MRSTFTGTRPAALFGNYKVQSTGRQVDWDLVPDSYRQGAVTVAAGANALQNATDMTLNVPVGTTLAKGTVLDFGGGKFARLAQAFAGTGANQAGVLVDTLVTAISNGDTALVGGFGPKYIPAMTIMGELSSGKVIPLKLITATYTAASAAKAGNTGNGVLTAAGTPVVAGGQAGVYKIVFIEPASNLGTFIVEDPNGVVIGEGVVGTAFSNQIAFTIADGSTDFIAGDEFTFTVTQSDGSKCAGLIYSDATQGSLTDASTGYGMVVGGYVFENLLPEATGSPKVITAAQKAALALCGPGFVYEQYQDTRA